MSVGAVRPRPLHVLFALLSLAACGALEPGADTYVLDLRGHAVNGLAWRAGLGPLPAGHFSAQGPRLAIGPSRPDDHTAFLAAHKQPAVELLVCDCAPAPTGPAPTGAEAAAPRRAVGVNLLELALGRESSAQLLARSGQPAALAGERLGFNGLPPGTPGSIGTAKPAAPEAGAYWLALVPLGTTSASGSLDHDRLGGAHTLLWRAEPGVTPLAQTYGGSGQHDQPRAAGGRRLSAQAWAGKPGGMVPAMPPSGAAGSGEAWHEAPAAVDLWTSGYAYPLSGSWSMDAPSPAEPADLAALEASLADAADSLAELDNLGSAVLTLGTAQAPSYSYDPLAGGQLDLGAADLYELDGQLLLKVQLELSRLEIEHEAAQEHSAAIRVVSAELAEELAAAAAEHAARAENAPAAAAGSPAPPIHVEHLNPAAREEAAESPRPAADAG